MNSKLLNFRSLLLTNKPLVCCRCFIYTPSSNSPARISITTDKAKNRGILCASAWGKKQPTTTTTIIWNQIRWAMRGSAGYTKFAHGRFKQTQSGYAYFWYSLLGSLLLFTIFFDWESMVFRGREPNMRIEEVRQWHTRDSNIKSKEIESSMVNEAESHDDENANVDDCDVVKPKKDKMTFRNRKIVEYENRIRQYSTPDKIFRYFATLNVWNEKLEDYEVHMTPEDFVRALTYGAKQPEKLGLDRYNRFDPQMQKLETNIPEDSIFRLLNKHGIISFTDFIFLLTLLSTPTRHFEIAFYMFDLDGSGHIDMTEFEHLQTIIRGQTQSGQRHRDTRMTGSVIRENHQLNEYFFGEALDELLTVEKFVAFQRKLQAEVVKMEFELCTLRTRESDGERVMSEQTFCEMILAYAGFGPAKTKRMLQNVSSHFECEHSRGISLKDYEDFFQVLRSIADIDMALKFYTIAGASIDKDILKHVSKTVAGVQLSDHVIEVIFKLFDENGDGKLSHKEFVKVMKKRWMRGLQQPKDTGFVKFVESVAACTREMIF